MEPTSTTYLTSVAVPLDQLTPYPGNARVGDIPAIRRSLTAHGQYRAVIVQADDPDNPAAGGTVVAGNHTLAAARELGWTHLRAELHRLTDEQATRVNLVDNRTSDLGTYDDRALVELLGSLPDLDGTGYDPGDLDALAAALDPPPDPDDAEPPAASELWPTLSLRVPPTVLASWRAHVDTHTGDQVAAMAALLDVEYP